jgi:hypothetical protein
MRGVKGACKHIQHPLLHSIRVRGLAASVLKPWGHENSRVPLCTPAFTHIPVVTFPPSSSCLKKGGEKKGEEK